MRNHKIDGKPRKDRDYVLFEKDAFSFDFSCALAQMLRVLHLPEDLRSCIQALSEKFGTHKFPDDEDFETLRKFAWKYMKTPYEDAACMFLMMFSAMREPLIAAAKVSEPKNNDEEPLPKETNHPSENGSLKEWAGIIMSSDSKESVIASDSSKEEQIAIDTDEDPTF